jgi:transcriptional regulator with XRE-family HTH domain
MNFLIGQIIRERLEAKDITFRKFADHMGMTERNLQNFFKRKDISVLQLQRASEYLKEDLTTYFRPKNMEALQLNEPEVLYKKAKTVKVSLEVEGELDSMKHFHEFLKEVNTAGSRLGFKVG